MLPKRLLLLILISTAVRLVVAASVELSNDEVYYYLYALDLQPNYFDHPPGVGVLIWLFTGGLFLKHELFVRLGAVLCSAVGTLLIYRIGVAIKDERTGWYAALLYTFSIYASVIAGTFIIPDSPQLVCWLAVLLAMYQIIRSGASATFLKWCLFGLLTGLCILCKVHGIFLWFGFGLYILLFDRSLLKSPGLYVSALLTLVVISPIFIWNIQNDFITYRFHSDRVNETAFHIDYFLQALGGQLIYNNPINAGLIIAAFWALRSTSYLDKQALGFVLLNGLPIIVVVTVMSMFNSMLPHWSGPGFVVLTLLAAAWLAEVSKEKSTSFIPRSIKISGQLITVALIAAVLLIRFYPGTLGSKDPNKYGDGDFTLDMFGWKIFGNEFKTWFENQVKEGALSPDIAIVSHKWFPAAHLDFYVAAPVGKQVVGVGDLTDLHQYFWLNEKRALLQKGASALCVAPSNYTINLQENFAAYFESVKPVKTISVNRSGEQTRTFTIYLLENYLANDEVHRMLKN
ncbi:MAG: glycosyltransferase family 39 protein [Cyclobacteriaceae bacterium]|nr:glycosyltransferase family 39 protein [Cyclobacteriaceae bacterium]